MRASFRCPIQHEAFRSGLMKQNAPRQQRRKDGNVPLGDTASLHTQKHTPHGRAEWFSVVCGLITCLWAHHRVLGCLWADHLEHGALVQTENTVVCGVVCGLITWNTVRSSSSPVVVSTSSSCTMPSPFLIDTSFSGSSPSPPSPPPSSPPSPPPPPPSFSGPFSSPAASAFFSPSFLVPQPEPPTLEKDARLPLPNENPPP